MNNITLLATTTTKSSNLTVADNSYVLPLIISLSLAVVILLAILVIKYCRHKINRNRSKIDSEVAIMSMRSTGSRPISATSFSGDRMSSNLDGTKDSSTNDTRQSVSTISRECELSHMLQSQKLPDDGDVFKKTDELDVSAQRKQAVISTPDLPRLRTRSREIGPPSNIDSLVENREDTLIRASQLFKSGTKAFEFYSKTTINYEMKRDQLKLKRLIGKGNFGCVYVGEATGIPNIDTQCDEVAIKSMKSSAPDSEKQEFLYELEIMKLVNCLNHPNIIKMLGCVTRTLPHLIVLELMEFGNLQKFLRDAKSGDLYYNVNDVEDDIKSEQLLEFSLDVAKGMEGIASLQLLHRDLAARNILIDSSLTCKVADFGFAKDVLHKTEYRSKSVFQRPRPTRWLPPESLFTFKHSIQSDVWSYGIVLWEIVTLGNLPYPGMSTREVMRSMTRGYRMPRPDHCSPVLYKLMAECWQEKPHDRPTFSRLVERIQELRRRPDSKEMINMKKLHEEDYIDTLPPVTQEIMLDYASSETLC